MGPRNFGSCCRPKVTWEREGEDGAHREFQPFPPSRDRLLEVTPHPQASRGLWGAQKCRQGEVTEAGTAPVAAAGPGNALPIFIPCFSQPGSRGRGFGWEAEPGACSGTFSVIPLWIFRASTRGAPGAAGLLEGDPRGSDAPRLPDEIRAPGMR